MVKTYDPASLTLAEHFMQDRPRGMSDDAVEKLTKDLAKHIQQAVEDWFDERGPLWLGRRVGLEV